MLLIGAIAVLVVVVSMPRFRAHVLEANREDAQLTLTLLGSRVFEEPLPGEATNEAPAMAFGILDLVKATKRLDHRFPDARSTSTAGELLHHGYRFATGFVLEGLSRRGALVAWPNDYGRSGDIAYATTADGVLWGHPNRGLWSGADRTPKQQGNNQGLLIVDLSDEGWVKVDPSR